MCKQFGLNSEQGVIIPHSNRDNLMLKPEVVEAVKEGKFHIWAVKTIDQGLEILTGHPAGRRLKQGSYTKNSVHWRVDERIKALSKNLTSSKK